LELSRGCSFFGAMPRLSSAASSPYNSILSLPLNGTNLMVSMS